MEQKQELSLRNDVITGFSYSFCKALVDKLSKLCQEGKQAVGYDNEFILSEGFPSRLTSLTENILHHLGDQLPHTKWNGIDPMTLPQRGEKEGRELYEKRVRKVLSDAYEFLSIFEYSEENKDGDLPAASNVVLDASQAYWDASRKASEAETDPKLKTELVDLDITVRTLNIMRVNNVYTLGIMTRMTEKELLAIPGIGKKCLQEIKEIVEKKGFSLKKDE